MTIATIIKAKEIEAGAAAFFSSSTVNICLLPEMSARWKASCGSGILVLFGLKERDGVKGLEEVKVFVGTFEIGLELAEKCNDEENSFDDEMSCNASVFVGSLVFNEGENEKDAENEEEDENEEDDENEDDFEKVSLFVKYLDALNWVEGVKVSDSIEKSRLTEQMLGNTKTPLIVCVTTLPPGESERSNCPPVSRWPFSIEFK